MLSVNNDLVGKYICEEYFHYFFFFLFKTALRVCLRIEDHATLVYPSLNSRHCQIVARRWAATGSLVLYITVCTSMHNGTRPCHRTVPSCRAYLGIKRRASTKERNPPLRNRMVGGFCETVRLIVQDGREKLVGSPATRFDSNVGILSSETSDSIWKGKRSHSRYYLEFSSALRLLFSAKTVTIDSSVDTCRWRNYLDTFAIYFHD